MIFKRNYFIVILLAILLSLSGCGGGSSSTTTISGPVVSSPVPPGANVLPIIIDGGNVAGVNYVNGPFVSVTVCVPRSLSNCQTIDHVLLDSGSTGLRIFSTVLTNLAVANALLPVSVGGSALAECAVFASGYTWGAVKWADVHLSGETAISVPIHIMADPSVPTIPNTCSSRSFAGPQNSVQAFGANGVLGVSTFQQDCGSGCSQSPPPLGWYYTCPTTGCVPASATLVQQVQNPVGALNTADNNGVVIVLPAIPAAGAGTVNGSLILGIGIQSNNALGSATSYDLDVFGNLLTTYKNQLMSAFVDSGSNALFFSDAAIPIPVCNAPFTGFYCPTTDLPLGAVIQGATNGKTASINFTVANAKSLFTNSPSNTAFNNLAGTSVLPGTFDWGLPFFFGRQVYFAIEQKSTPLGTGPFVAF